MYRGGFPIRDGVPGVPVVGIPRICVDHAACRPSLEPLALSSTVTMTVQRHWLIFGIQLEAGADDIEEQQAVFETGDLTEDLFLQSILDLQQPVHHDHGTRHPTHDLGNRACFVLARPNQPRCHQPAITPLCRDCWSDGPLQQVPARVLCPAHDPTGHDRPRSCGGPQPSFLPPGVPRSRYAGRSHAKGRR